MERKKAAAVGHLGFDDLLRRGPADAVAVVSLMIAGADSKETPDEMQQLLASLQERFGLTNEQAAEILEVSRTLQEQGADLESVVRILYYEFSENDWRWFASYLAELAAADGQIHSGEVRLGKRVFQIAKKIQREEKSSEEWLDEQSS